MKTIKELITEKQVEEILVGRQAFENLQDGSFGKKGVAQSLIKNPKTPKTLRVKASRYLQNEQRIRYYAQAVHDGLIKIDEVPDNYRMAVDSFLTGKHYQNPYLNPRGW